MGRHASFDRVTVVRAARQLFWEQGYAGTSLPQLELATGLQRSSLYHAFDSKQGLFEACLDSYLDELIRPALAPLRPQDADASHVSPTALEEYLRNLKHLVDASRESAEIPRGCLMIGSANSPIGSEPPVSAAIASYRSELRAAVGHGVSARRPQQSVQKNEILADAVVALIVAAFASARTSTDTALDSLNTARKLLTL